MKQIHISAKPIYIPSRYKEDIYQLFLLAEQEFSSCFFFESLGEHGMLSRYSILGFDPKHTIIGKEKSVMVDTKKISTHNAYAFLQKIMPQDKVARNYAGGLVGYLGYDAMNLFESSLAIRSHPLFPQFMFDVYTDGVIYDKYTGELTYFYYDENRLSLILSLLKKVVFKKKIHIRALRADTTKKEHAVQVKQVKEEILKGNTFQTVIGIQHEFSYTGDAVVLYDRLRKVNPSPFMYFFKSGDIRIIGASPELLFGMRDKQMQTFPLAGTIKRGKTAHEDMDFAYQLLTDPKERAEHSMLIDLHRNDMGKVARFGSVKVKTLMDIKRFSHVQHIGSEIVGLLGRGEDMFSAVAANFPAGTLTGAPKIASMKLIDRMEKSPRGPYGGGIGHFGFNGDCTFSIPIRTIFLSGNDGFTQAGSGIVADSTAEKEYDEVQRKLAAMKEVLGV